GRGRVRPVLPGLPPVPRSGLHSGTVAVRDSADVGASPGEAGGMTLTVADLTVTGDQLRAAVGTFPSGVTVVTTLKEDGSDVGLTVSAFSSLSLEPAMVVLAVDNGSTSLPYLTVGAPLGISVLADGQGPVAYQFSRRGVDRFAGVDTHRGG